MKTAWISALGACALVSGCTGTSLRQQAVVQCPNPAPVVARPRPGVVVELAFVPDASKGGGAWQIENKSDKTLTLELPIAVPHHPTLCRSPIERMDDRDHWHCMPMQLEVARDASLRLETGKSLALSLASGLAHFDQRDIPLPAGRYRWNVRVQPDGASAWHTVRQEFVVQGLTAEQTATLTTQLHELETRECGQFTWLPQRALVLTGEPSRLREALFDVQQDSIHHGIVGLVANLPEAQDMFDQALQTPSRLTPLVAISVLQRRVAEPGMRDLAQQRLEETLRTTAGPIPSWLVSGTFHAEWTTQILGVAALRIASAQALELSDWLRILTCPRPMQDAVGLGSLVAALRARARRETDADVVSSLRERADRLDKMLREQRDSVALGMRIAAGQQTPNFSTELAGGCGFGMAGMASSNHECANFRLQPDDPRLRFLTDPMTVKLVDGTESAETR